MRVQSTKFTSSSLGILEEHFMFDLGVAKENKLFVCNIKTVRKLQVILSYDKLPVKMKQSSSKINKGFSTCPALT